MLTAITGINWGDEGKGTSNEVSSCCLCLVNLSSLSEN